MFYESMIWKNGICQWELSLLPYHQSRAYLDDMFCFLSYNLLKNFKAMEMFCVAPAKFTWRCGKVHHCGFCVILHSILWVCVCFRIWLCMYSWLFNASSSIGLDEIMVKWHGPFAGSATSWNILGCWCQNKQKINTRPQHHYTNA